jgi:bacillithiol biosynthesis cysteine-adding enzyme BshC
MKLIDSLGYRSGVHTPMMQRFFSDDKQLTAFHNGFYTTEAAKEYAAKRAQTFSKENREVLVQGLKNQYAALAENPKRTAQINLLAKPNTLTVTTGHQLNLFTGPLFFWYKIMEVITMAEQLQNEDKKNNYVPVFWMASEDHDIEEINHFFLGEQKIRWQAPTSGPVGRISTENLEDVFERLKLIWGTGVSAKELLDLFMTSYLKKKSLAHATRTLVDRLFGHHGLLIIDGDDPLLKKQFIPHIKDELTKQLTYSNVAKTDKQLAKNIDGYKPQVGVREINLFYMLDGVRTRIIRQENDFTTVDDAFFWNKNQLLDEVEQHPERFSPNALMRPMYQETMLPNIAYVGGGGELAYWMQLKSTFDAFKVSFPLLQLRKSLLLLSEKQVKKCKKLSLPFEDLFLPTASFINKRVRQISDVDIDLSAQREVLQKQFVALRVLATKTDKSFLGAVAAQEKKQLKGLAKLEKRLLKAQRLRLKDEVVRTTDVRHELFPNGILQERIVHFSAFIGEDGIDAFGQKLKTCMATLPNGLTIIQL